MKRYSYILSLWTLALVVGLTSCTYDIDNPVIPVGPAADEYAFDDEMDKSVKPGDDFFDYVVGSWVKAYPYNEYGWMGTFAEQAYSGETWAGKSLNADCPDPVVADLFRRLSTANDDFDANVARMRAKTDAIAALATREEVLTEYGNLLRQGYEPGFYTMFGGNREKIFMTFFAENFSEDDNLDLWMNYLGFTDEETDRILTLAADFIDKSQWNDDNQDRSANVRIRKTKKAAKTRSLSYWSDPENVRKTIPYLRSKARTRSRAEGQPTSDLLIAAMGVNPEFFLLADQKTEEVLSRLEELAATPEGLEKLKAVMQLAIIKRDGLFIDTITESDLVYVLMYKYYPMNYQLNQLYAEQMLTADLRNFVSEMCEEFRSAFAERIRRLDWMSDATKQTALQKLQKTHFIVGATDRPDSRFILSPVTTDGTLYEALVSLYEQFMILTFKYIPGTSGVDNVVTVELTEERMWESNARFYRSFNIVNIFGSNLIPPVCAPALGDAYNYGLLGASTIGHELTHGFDAIGSHYDGDGKLVDWWTPAEYSVYEEKRQQIADHFNVYEAVPGRHLNGQSTADENIADLGGLETALDVITNRCHRAGFRDEALDEQTRAFLQSFAQAWKTNDSDNAEYIEWLLDYGEHSPDKWRVNAQVNNLDVWYRLYDVTATQRLYVAPEKRVHIW